MRTNGRTRLSRRSILFRLYISCFLIIAVIAIQGQITAESDEVHVFIDGPEMVQTNTTTEYTIKITGGPAEEGGNWSFEARLEGEEGEELTSEEGKVEPDNGTSTENIFRVNVTTPKTEQIIKLAVNGTSFINETNMSWSGDVFQEIKVFEPIIVNISVLIKNTGQMDVEGAVVYFYVFHTDGTSTSLGNKTVDVPANNTKKVYMEWAASKDDEGEHEVEVRIDENEALLEFDNGDNIMRKTIYVGERPQREMHLIMVLNTSLLLVIQVFAIIFVIAAFMMRRQTLRGRKHYSPRSTYTMYFFGILMIALSLAVFYVSQILSANPELSGDPIVRLIDGILLFVLGFATILLTWDRTRKKRR